MNQEQKTSIIEYLKGPRVYAEGVALYRRFGNNRMLMRQFELDETSTTRESSLMHFADWPAFRKRSFTVASVGQTDHAGSGTHPCSGATQGNTGTTGR